jgi:hypothetical protein
VTDLNDTWIFLTSLGHGGHHRQGSDRTKKVTVIAKSPTAKKVTVIANKIAERPEPRLKPAGPKIRP